MSPPPFPSKQEIDQLRNAGLKKIEEESGSKNYDPIDVRRLKNDDKWIQRFLMHHDNDQKLALNMLMNTLQFRVDMKCNSIKVENISPEFFDIGALFVHNRDKNGFKILVFSVTKHQKGTVDMDMLKRFFIYWLDRLDREENGEWISVFFDMRDTGMKNMDMEFIQYMIKLFDTYYPWFLNYIIVFEMPWLLTAMWKIIKGWIPPKAVEKIKFVDKKSLLDLVSPDQSLVGWGGEDSYEYKFDPEVFNEIKVNGEMDSRKVHFADGSMSPPASPSKEKLLRKISSTGNVLIEIEPNEELMFSNCQIGATANIFLTNPTSFFMAFKIKTTSPDKYRVRPSVGILEPGGRQDVNVTVNERLAPASLVRDKFLVMGIVTQDENLNTQELAQIFKTMNKDDAFELRLRVGVAAQDGSKQDPNTVDSAQSAVNPLLLLKIDQLLQRQTAVEDQLRSAKKFVFAGLIVMVVILCVLVMATNNMTSNILMHSIAMHGANTYNQGHHSNHDDPAVEL